MNFVLKSSCAAVGLVVCFALTAPQVLAQAAPKPTASSGKYVRMQTFKGFNVGRVMKGKKLDVCIVETSAPNDPSLRLTFYPNNDVDLLFSLANDAAPGTKDKVSLEVRSANGSKRAQFDMVQKADNRLWTTKPVSDEARDALLEEGEEMILTVDSTKKVLKFQLQPDYGNASATIDGCLLSYGPER